MKSAWITLWQKEVREELYTWKSTLWLLVIALIFSVASYVFLTNKELSLLDQTELLWLFSKIILGSAFLVVSIDASSSVASEFEQETAESLFLTPLTLWDFLLAKFFASLSLWAAIYVVAVPYMIVTASGTSLTLAFLAYMALFGTLGLTALLGVIFGTALLFRSTKNTLTTSLVILLGLTVPALFSTTLKNNPAGKILSTINPLDGIFAALDNILVDYKLSLLEQWQYLLPVLIFIVVSFVYLRFAARRFRRLGVVSTAS